MPTDPKTLNVPSPKVAALTQTAAGPAGAGVAAPSELPAPSTPAAIEWPLAGQIWRDWRAAITARYDAQSKQILERAWAAGLVDGAAKVSVAPESGGRQAVIEVVQSQGDEGRINLMRFQQALGGCGTILGPYPQIYPAPYYYLWRVTDAEEIRHVWEILGPFVGLSKFIEFRRVLASPALRAHRTNGAKPLKRPAEQKGRGTKSPKRKHHQRTLAHN